MSLIIVNPAITDTLKKAWEPTPTQMLSMKMLTLSDEILGRIRDRIDQQAEQLGEQLGDRALTLGPRRFLRGIHPTGGLYCGMFSVFTGVLGVLNEYNSNPHKYTGVEIDLEDNGMYYEPSRGDNWWSYYLEPIKIGEKSNNIVKVLGDYARFTVSAECDLSRAAANALIKKYFKLRSEIQEKVDRFVVEHFDKDYTISIHYRGTDKVCDNDACEAKRVDGDAMIRSVKQHIDEKQLQKFKIFVASDEQNFIEKIKQAFPDKVIMTNIERSTNGKPLHNGGSTASPYELGEQALIDSLLLSRGNILFRTSSNLSLWSKYFNPDLPVVELSKRNGYHNCKYGG